MAIRLFDFQKKAVRDLLKGFQTNRVQCLAWYTGAGKTNVFFGMILGISAYLTREIKPRKR